MKATIKFEDGREAVIELTPQQVNAVEGKKKINKGLITINYDNRGAVVGMFPRNNPLHTFKTEKHAQLLADRFNLEMEMFRWASEMNEGWVPVWGDNTPHKYGIVWTSVYRDIQIEEKQERNEFVFGLSFKNKEIAQQALELFGGRILSLYGKQF